VHNVSATIAESADLNRDFRDNYGYALSLQKTLIPMAVPSVLRALGGVLLLEDARGA